MSFRIFLVGNGVSLKKTNLDLLIGHDSMALNKIYKFYNKTNWRPTHYVKVDFSAFDPGDWRFEIMCHVSRGEQCLLWDAFRAGADPRDGNYEFIHDGIGDFPNVRYIPRCEHHYQLKGAWHNLCTGPNSILTMVLWAAELGYEEIVFVGCDGKFTDPKEDHFIEDYNKVVDAEYVSRNNTCVQAAHKIISENCPVPILDATVDGYLTQYPKVRLEDVVSTRILQS